jgi:hypothetical protein
VHFLGLCRLRGMKYCWLELLQYLLNYEITIYGFWFGVPMYICLGWDAYIYMVWVREPILIKG